MFPKTVEDLDEKVFSGNTLLYPYGQHPISQINASEFIDPRKSIKQAQNFIKTFWESWMLNMPPHLLLRNKWFRPTRNLKKGDYVIALKPGLKGHPAPEDCGSTPSSLTLFQDPMVSFARLNYVFPVNANC